ncbi:VPLPA-CTERM sorting domain-containing protein [Methylomonas sp. 2BW1-5-20]|uniref:VPLPA-CTERM sorting domain-containing protein n=1 Tax=Methylomonas sp. 2BW1-5-20 TaxID=3376686 RepID=UPI0040531A9D
MRLHSLATALLTSLVSIDAYASIDVFSQAPNTTFSASSAVYNVSSDPGFTWSLDQDEEAWAYFNVPTDLTFNRIAWYGSNSDGKFAVDFFAASCFSCGANWVGTNGKFSNSLLPNPGPFSQAQIHKTLVSGNLYSYYIDLASSLTLDHTSLYALSVVNNYTATPFSWSESNIGSGSHLDYIVGRASFLRASGSLAFTLTDTTASAVPLPASAWLLSSGLVCLLGFSRKARTI